MIDGIDFCDQVGGYSRNTSGHKKDADAPGNPSTIDPHRSHVKILPYFFPEGEDFPFPVFVSALSISSDTARLLSLMAFA